MAATDRKHQLLETALDVFSRRGFEGATTKEVAQRLGISTKTAQAHRNNLKQKLELRSTAELVRYAIKHKVSRID